MWTGGQDGLLCRWDREVHTCVKSYPVTDCNLEDITATQLTSSQPGIRGLSSHQNTNSEANDHASSVKKEIKDNGNPASIGNGSAADGEDPVSNTKDDNTSSHVHTSSSQTPSNKTKAVDGEDSKLNASGSKDDHSSTIMNGNPNPTDEDTKSSTATPSVEQSSPTDKANHIAKKSECGEESDGFEPDTPLLVFTQHAELLMMKPNGKFTILVQVSTVTYYIRQGM